MGAGTDQLRKLWEQERISSGNYGSRNGSAAETMTYETVNDGVRFSSTSGNNFLQTNELFFIF